MHTHTSHYRSPQPQLWQWRAGLALGMTLFSIIGFIGITPAAQASEIPGGNVTDPMVRAVDIAKPAVVRIFTTINGQVTVHFSPKQSVTFPLNGKSYSWVATGSGTFISAHGDILTADHVVNPPHDSQSSQYVDMNAARDVANYINKHIKSNPPVTQDEIEQELTSGQLPSDLHYGTVHTQVFLSTDYSGPLTVTDLKGVPGQLQASVDRIEASSASNKKDVAIVHVNLNDTPSVQLEDSSGIQQQDGLTIIGFPGAGDVSQSPTNLLATSVNEILVSSVKTTDQGAQVIQVAGNIEDGDSGGPALDSNGNVVGVVSFGLSDQGSTNFLQASDSAKGLVQRLHLDTTPGPLQNAWSQAFNDYAATTPGHWHKAQQELAAIRSHYPLFLAIMPYLQQAQTQARQERVPQHPTASPQPQSHTISPLVWTILAAVVVIVFTLAFFAPTMTMRRRKNKAPLTPTILLPAVLPQTTQALEDIDAMVAFGAPTTSPLGQVSAQPQPSGVLPGMPVATARASGGLRPWHMNDPEARYYTMWGEAVEPIPITQDVE